MAADISFAKAGVMTNPRANVDKMSFIGLSLFVRHPIPMNLRAEGCTEKVPIATSSKRPSEDA